MRLYLVVCPAARWEIDDKAVAFAKTLQQLFWGRSYLGCWGIAFAACRAVLTCCESCAKQGALKVDDLSLASYHCDDIFGVSHVPIFFSLFIACYDI